MLSFEYNGQSTKTILDTPLMVVQFDVTNDITGFSREIVKGEKTMLRQETNHYGAMYSDESTYEFYLVKENGHGFTNSEQRKINKWLTSPTLVKPLTGIADDKETVIYKGIFQNIGWKMITCKLGQLDAVQCSFVCDTPFIWKHYEISGEVATSNKFSTNIFVDSDDAEYEIYPKVTITSKTSQTVIIEVRDENSMSPDGKEVIARENEVSAKRKEDPSKAYFGCHTDITIPYRELQSVAVEKADGTTIPLIEDGRFVLPGTEELNEPFG